MKFKLFINIIIIIIFCSSKNVYGNTILFDEGKKLYQNKKYKDAKFKFEKDIVFNPTNEYSYLFLAKIFNKQKKVNLEENNLNTVILLNPKNEEAIYYLALLSIQKSNFLKAKELIKSLDSVCSKFCSSKKELEKKLENSSK
jgi:tetratricopeptide (TPR) repeat protein|tara:strand:- start:57 stop:482 length:426 start_codon:yes stop_codon:yes gene_type:complete